jgi:tetratricopeptide (TPR) repeat protein
MSRCFLAVVFVGVVMPASAVAQTMEFTEEEAEESQSPSSEETDGKLAETMAEAVSLYDKEKYREASRLFYDVVQKGGETSRAQEARFELGKTLYRMELYQGALAQFGRIVEAGEGHPYFIPTLRGLLSLMDVLSADPTLRKYLAAYVERFPREVPEEHRDRYAYFVGRYFYSELDVDRAVEMFDAVGRASPFFGEARYIKGITYVANYQAKPAVSAFKTVLRHLARQAGSDEGLDAEQRKLRELTHLAMARVFYSTGDYETSLKYYDRVDRESPRWPKALFEKSWAYFQTDDYNKALGNLHSLNSPFFVDAYFPEGPILSGLLYFYNCRYDQVRRELKNFERMYQDLRGEMQAVLDTHSDASAMFEWYGDVRAGEVDLPRRVYRILRAAVDDRQVQSAVELVDLAEQELAKIESMPKKWRDSPLGQTLMQEASLAQSFAIDEAGSLVRQRLQRHIRELDRLINEKKRILIEVAKAEKGAIEADIRAGQRVERDDQEAALKVTDEELYWTFRGEYWRDELGHYVFNVESQCKR